MKNLCFSNIFIEKQSALRLHPLIQHLLRHNDIAYRFFPQIDKHLMLTTTKPLIQQGFLKSYKNTPTKGKSLKDLPFQSVKEPQFSLSENWGSGIVVILVFIIWTIAYDWTIGFPNSEARVVPTIVLSPNTESYKKQKLELPQFLGIIPTLLHYKKETPDLKLYQVR